MMRTHRTWSAVVMLAGAAGLFVSGCAAPGTNAARDPAIVVRDGGNGHTVAMTVGQRLEVILGSTYWTVRGSSKPGVLRQDGPTTLLPRPADCAANIPGLGCVPVRTDFSALSPGTTVITASRVTCGEALRCMPAQQHYTLTVVVRANS